MATDDIFVAIIVDEHHSQVVSRYDGDKYRPVFPVELCTHKHDTIEEAVRCGSKRALIFASMLNTLGKNIALEIEEEVDGSEEGS